MTVLLEEEREAYSALYKPNQLIRGTGHVAVVTGWTVKETVAKKLATSDYAVIGQLYSPTRGIDFLIRNLLYNPHVGFLVIVDATKEDKNARGCDCLLDFFRYGFDKGVSDAGKPCWVLRSPVPGYIDLEVEASALERLRGSLTVEKFHAIAPAIECVKFRARQPAMPWGKERLTFPKEQAESRVLPGDRYGHRITGKTIAETWVRLLHRIKTTGTIRPTAYDGRWQELIDVMAIVTAEPTHFFFPEPNYLPVDRAFIQQYLAQILDDAPKTEGVKYTYGQRLRSHFGRDQIDQVIRKLRHDIDSARAVMSLWDVGDGELESSPPCLNHIWVRAIDNELSLTATLRSNDMFAAWPANAFGLRALQQLIRDEICRDSDRDLQMGPLITVSQSAHIYDDCWENTEKLLQAEYARICRERDYSDPVGSFLIGLQPDELLVEQATPGSGEVIQCYRGKSAVALYQAIAAACPGLESEHGLYLGTELQKAEIALKYPQQFVYEQDRPLRSLI